MKLTTGNVESVKFGLFKNRFLFEADQRGFVLEKDDGAVCLYATDASHESIYCAIPMGPYKNLKYFQFYLFCPDDQKLLCAVGRALFVVDYAAKKIATSVVGLRAFGNGEWGENVQMPWRGDYPALFDQPANTDDMDLNFAKLFWHWFSVNETDIVKMLGMGKKEEKSVYYQTHLWLCPAFPYVKPNAIRFELEPSDEKHRFVFHHGGNEALMDDAPAMGGLMPEGLADRWDFEIEE